jgi:hypothetical protein
MRLIRRFTSPPPARATISSLKARQESLRIATAVQHPRLALPENERAAVSPTELEWLHYELPEYRLPLADPQWRIITARRAFWESTFCYTIGGIFIIMVIAMLVLSSMSQ